MAARAAKRNRSEGTHPTSQSLLLQSLLSSGGVRQKALRGILKRLEDSPGELANVSNSLAVASEARYQQVRHVEMLQTRDGDFAWEFCEPNLLMSMLIGECPHLQHLHARAANLQLDSDWTLAIGYDEYVPGSKFLIDSNRKSMNLSFTFMELGPEATYQDACWFLPVSVRTEIMQNTHGGWSNMLRRYVTLQLLWPNGLSTAGVPIMVIGQVYLLRAKLKILITDGDGHRVALQWRGAKSVHPCFRHNNVLKKGSGLSHRRANFVEIGCVDWRLMRLVPTRELYGDVDSVIDGVRRHEAGTMNLTTLERMRFVTGLNATKDGLLADLRLRNQFDIVDAVYFDWVHTCLQDGILTVETTVFLQACVSNLELGYDAWENYLQGGWLFPGAYAVKSKQVHRIFNAHRVNSLENAGHVKCRSAEALSLCSLTRHFSRSQASWRLRHARTRILLGRMLCYRYFARRETIYITHPGGSPTPSCCYSCTCRGACCR